MNPTDWKYFVIVDLEATCSNDNAFPREEREIIEIGAVMIKRKTLQVVDEFTVFIKPVKNQVLTDFCTELTSITQEDVDNGLGFSDGLELFVDWVYPFNVKGDVLFCSWGAFDKNQLRRDCEVHGAPYPFGERHLNLKTKFSHTQGRKKQYGLAKAMRIAQIEMDGTQHRGIDDARNMAKLMPYIVGDEKV